MLNLSKLLLLLLCTLKLCISLLSIFFKFVYLEGIETEAGIGKERQISHLLVYSLCVSATAGASFGLKPEAKSRVQASQLLELLPTACWDALVGSWNQKQSQVLNPGCLIWDFSVVQS